MPTPLRRWGHGGLPKHHLRDGMPARESGEPKPRLIDRQNRVALPPEVLRALQVKAGDYVSFDIDGAVVRIHKVKWVVEKK